MKAELAPQIKQIINSGVKPHTLIIFPTHYVSAFADSRAADTNFLDLSGRLKQLAEEFPTREAVEAKIAEQKPAKAI